MTQGVWGPRAHGSPNLYVITCTAGDVKIGRTNDVHQRLRKFVNMCPASAGIRLLHHVNDFGKYELGVHWALSDHRTHAEWFDPDAGKLLAAMAPEAFAQWVQLVSTEYQKTIAKYMPWWPR